MLRPPFLSLCTAAALILLSTVPGACAVRINPGPEEPLAADDPAEPRAATAGATGAATGITGRATIDIPAVVGATGATGPPEAGPSSDVAATGPTGTDDVNPKAPVANKLSRSKNNQKRPAACDERDTICFGQDVHNAELKNHCMKKSGAQVGSNLGGCFSLTGPVTATYYVKIMVSDSDKHSENSQARVEALAAQLYKQAGVAVVDADYIKARCLNMGLGQMLPPSLPSPSPSSSSSSSLQVRGSLTGATDVLVSKKANIDDIPLSDIVKLDGLRSAMVVDAWLANWDVIGNGGPQQLNMKRIKGTNKALRMDTGGTLFYRAHGGGLKHDLWNDEVGELKMLRKRGNAAVAFKDVTPEDLAEGARAVQRVTPDKIKALVNRYLSGERARETIARLIARRAKILGAGFLPASQQESVIDASHEEAMKVVVDNHKAEVDSLLRGGPAERKGEKGRKGQT